MSSTTFNVKDILDNSNKSVTYKINFKKLIKINSIIDDCDSSLVYREMKVSDDDSTYSYWSELNLSKLNEYLFTDDTFLKIRISLNDNNTVVPINKLIIDFNGVPDAVTYKQEQEKTTLEFNAPKFDVYQNPSIAISLNQELSKSYNLYAGLDALYFKSDVISTDTFLQEHTLYQMADECGTAIKVLFEDNAMPKGPTITPFGTQFEQPIHVHIDYLYFKEKFDTHVPSHNDVIFVPATKGIWEVNGSNLIRGAMNAPVYWDVILVKYQPKGNRNEDTLRHESILDNLKEQGYNIMSAEQAFSATWRTSEEKAIKPRETRIEGAKKYQKESFVIHKGVKVITEEIENNFIIISHFNYDLSNVNKNDAALTYNFTYETNKDISYTSWCKFPIIDDSYSLMIRIANQQVYSTKYTETTEPIVVADKDNNLFTINVNGKTVVETIADGTYYIKDPVYTNIFNDWYMLNNEYIVNEQLGINEQLYKVDPSKWYNIIITYSDRFNQVGIYIYELAPHNENILLRSKKTIDLDIQKIYLESLTINGGLRNITNIRLFNEMLQESDHSIVLNQQLVNDSHKALVIDNTKLDLIQTNYGKPL